MSTTTAGEDETSEGNPENKKRDAVDVAPSVPAHEDKPAAEPSPENKAAAVPTTVTEEPATVEPATVEPATVEPATAEPTTSEPATAEPARRGPVDQELHLTLDNPTDRALFQLGRLPTKLRATIIHHGPYAAQKESLLSEARMSIYAFSMKDTTMHILGQWK